MTAEQSKYELVYWPSAPGRGEHIRLALEEAGAEYSDTGHAENAMKLVLGHISDENLGGRQNPPPFAPPIFKHGDLVLSQTPNILMYLGPKLGLAGSKPNDIYRINALALTALDCLSNEVHDCHHPICTGLYYEDQKEESIRRSKEWVKTRLPKHLAYFQKVLTGEASGDGPWLYGGMLTYADLVLFQVTTLNFFREPVEKKANFKKSLDGTMFQFPKATQHFKKSGNYNKVFELHEAVKSRPKIAAYLASKRKFPYSMGIFRYYEDLDVVPE